MATDRVRAIQDLRRSGAAGTHDSDLPRGEEKRQAIADQDDYTPAEDGKADQEATP